MLKRVLEVPYHVLEVKGLHLEDGFDPRDGNNLHLGNDLREQHTREDAPDCPGKEKLSILGQNGENAFTWQQ